VKKVLCTPWTLWTTNQSSKVFCCPRKDYTRCLLSTEQRFISSIRNTTKWRLRVMSSGCVFDLKLCSHIPKNMMHLGASTCLLMCTHFELWPSSWAWSAKGWGSPWKCVEEKVIGPLMESVRFRAPELCLLKATSTLSGLLPVDMRALRSWRLPHHRRKTIP